jgi:hypothetical protein
MLYVNGNITHKGQEARNKIVVKGLANGWAYGTRIWKKTEQNENGISMTSVVT